MQIYDVCLMSDWHYDRDLLVELENRLQLRGRTTYLVWPENLEDVLERLREGTLSFRYFVDRATNTSAEFSDVYRFLPVPGATCFEDPGTLLRASDKALMHQEFQTAGIPVPDTLIIQPHAESEEIRIDLQAVQDLGPPFVIKPANTTGGGVGVFQDGRGLEDILHRRLEYPSDKYLVQERILLDHQERLLVVDYVNESPDLRRKSQFVDGVPDQVVERVIENLAEWIHRELGDPAHSSS
jgi:glutathione synthase/RimK-type ligase-like ATP-grasp enzyme